MPVKWGLSSRTLSLFDRGWQVRTVNTDSAEVAAMFWAILSEQVVVRGLQRPGNKRTDFLGLLAFFRIIDR